LYLISGGFCSAEEAWDFFRLQKEARQELGGAGITASATFQIEEKSLRLKGKAFAVGGATLKEQGESCRPEGLSYRLMQKKIFWIVFLGLGLIADFMLPFVWAAVATIPILGVSLWIAYRSGWFSE